jgi:hypothetical protein
MSTHVLQLNPFWESKNIKIEILRCSNILKFSTIKSLLVAQAERWNFFDRYPMPNRTLKKSSDHFIVPFKSKRLEGISFAIDAQDYDLYVGNMPSWFLSGSTNNYATADWLNCPRGRRTIRLHRYLILGLEDNQNRVVDHINGDTLDNRRCNLRVLTRGANVAHRANLNSNNTSGVRGVYWCKRNKKWIACIHNWWKKSFEDKDEAIREIGEQRKVYNATHGISERVVQRLPELVEPNRLMKELYVRGNYVNNVRSEQWRTDYNERLRRQNREKREKLKEELLKQPQTGDVIKELRRIESYELRAQSRAS